jgi:hypothetical protein
MQADVSVPAVKNLFKVENRQERLTIGRVDARRIK